MCTFECGARIIYGKQIIHIKENGLRTTIYTDVYVS